jgi:AraC-like DNA-binding protein
LTKKPPLRTIRTGTERIAPGLDLPRHRHVEAYATVVLSGAYEQTGYAGRLMIRAGDVVVQPTMDCHADRMISAGLELLRVPWRWSAGYGGIYRGCDVETVRAAAARDQLEATLLLEDLVDRKVPATSLSDWEDLVALRLRDPHVRITEIAEDLGLSRERLSRGFSRVYGISPVAYRGELRTRQALLEIIATRHRLCDIAVASGFADQPHMTRSVREMMGASPTAFRHRAAFAPLDQRRTSTPPAPRSGYATLRECLATHSQMVSAS